MMTQLIKLFLSHSGQAEVLLSTYSILLVSDHLWKEPAYQDTTVVSDEVPIFLAMPQDT